MKTIAQLSIIIHKIISSKGYKLLDLRKLPNGHYDVTLDYPHESAPEIYNTELTIK